MDRDRAPARAVLAFPFWGKSGTAHVTVQCWGGGHCMGKRSQLVRETGTPCPLGLIPSATWQGLSQNDCFPGKGSGGRPADEDHMNRYWSRNVSV